MKMCRYLSRLRNSHARASWRGKRLLRVTGTISCLLAILISAGAHWAVLQSFAYTRMLVEFAEQGSLGTAVKKAFDERYACSLCPKIRDGFNKEQKKPSVLSEVYQPEFLLGSNPSIFFTPVMSGGTVFVSPGHADFSEPPPKPPPRLA